MKNSFGTKALLAAISLALLVYFGVQGVNYHSNDPHGDHNPGLHLLRVEEASISPGMVREEQVLGGRRRTAAASAGEEGRRVSSGEPWRRCSRIRPLWTCKTELASLGKTGSTSSNTPRRQPWAWRSRRSWTAQINNSILDLPGGSRAAGPDQDTGKAGGRPAGLVMKQDFSISGTEDLKTRLQGFRHSGKR